MPKKVTTKPKPKYSVDPWPPVSTARDIVHVDGIDLPEITADILKLYYDAFLKRGFSTEQAFQLTLQWTKFYLGT